MYEIATIFTGRIFSAHPFIAVVLLAICLMALALATAPAMAQGYGVKDAALLITKALKNGSGAVTSGAIDTGLNAGVAQGQANQPGNMEFALNAPALTTTQLPDTHTVTYAIIQSDNSDLSSPSTVIANAIIQTGAGGAGAAAAAYKFRLPPEAKRYIGFTATNSGADDASGASATLQPTF